MSPFGCRPTAVEAQSGMGTASRAAAVVRQYSHFRRPDGFRFSQRSPAGIWILAAPTIKFEIWRNIMYQMMQLVSEQFYMSARKWSLVFNSLLRVAVGHPFLAVGGLKEAQRAPVQEHVTPFNPTSHLPVARGGGTPAPLRVSCGRTHFSFQ
jgi:hypothetical protein